MANIRELKNLYLLCLLYALATYLLYLFHFGFAGQTSMLDLGVYRQMLWGVLHGGLPLDTVHFNRPVNWLGIHFDPLVILLGLPGELFGFEWWLNAVQSVAQAAAGIPLYLLARHAGISQGRALLWVMVLFLNPFYLNAALWDFHETALSCPLIMLICYGIFTEKWRLTVISCLLLLTVKEHYGVAVAAAGVLWWLRTKQAGRAASLIVVGSAAFVLIVFVIMPYLGDGLPPMLREGSYSRYSWLYSFLPQLEVQGAFVTLLSAIWLPYWGMLLAWGFFTSLLYPLPLLLGAADLITNSLSDTSMMRSVFAYHSAPLIPLVVSAAMIANEKIWRLRPMPVLMAIMAALSLAAYSTPAALWGERKILWRWQPDPAIAEIKSLLNDNDRILTQNDVGAHFADRRYVYLFPKANGASDINYDDVDVIISYESFPYINFGNKSADDIFFNNPYNLDTYQNDIAKIKVIKCFDVIYSKDFWHLLRRNSECSEHQAGDKQAD